jgi:hypothetical protein
MKIEHAFFNQLWCETNFSLVDSKEISATNIHNSFFEIIGRQNLVMETKIPSPKVVALA